jgi:hypothetical protein
MVAIKNALPILRMPNSTSNFRYVGTRRLEIGITRRKQKLLHTDGERMLTPTA